MTGSGEGRQVRRTPGEWGTHRHVVVCATAAACGGRAVQGPVS